MALVLFLTIVFPCLLQSTGTLAFNVDIGSAIIYDGPQQGQYFGYSVALHSLGNKRWVLVGAPLSNVSGAQGLLLKYGDVYKCEYTGSSQPCDALRVDNQEVQRKTFDMFNNQPNVELDMEEKSGQWLGGTVYSTGKDGKVVTCASRYIYRGPPPNTGTDLQYRWLLGRCFPINSDLSGVSSTILDPCMDEYKGNNYYGYCQSGFSAEYTADGSDVIMGAVGVTRWKGGLIHYSSAYKSFQLSAQDQIDIGDYMGYAVTSGHFSSPLKTEVVGGAPRAEGCKGKVLIYDILENQLAVSSPLPQPKNIPTGTYFGSVLCAVDLDNDDYTDILVGAPYYTHVKDEGRVFIYLNNKQGALNLQEQVLEGDRKINAHFGQAIAAVGDLNHDGYQDVAIGAPLEDDGRGAVYIYHGSSKGIERQYRQKILGSTVKSGINLKMFGLSISGGLDVDDNKYPDIAVGAYGSNNAVLFRTKRIVNVEGAIKLSKTQINLENNKTLCTLDGGEKHQCLNMTVCFSYEDQVNTPGGGALKIKYMVELDKGRSDALRRMFFYDKSTKVKQFIIEGNYTIPKPKALECLPPRTVYLMDKDKVGDVGSLLTFDVDFNLPPPPCAGLCSVLNDYLPNTYRAVASFQKQCKDQVCVPDLAVNGSLLFSPKTYEEVIIGPVKEFTVQLVVSNKAEDSAYYSKIMLKYPGDLDYVGPDQPFECEREASNDGNVTVTCNVGNPLLGKSKKTFGIKFTPGTIKKSFIIEVEAKSQDVDANTKDNKKSFPVTVKFEADVEITGSSRHRQVVYSRTKRDSEEVKKSFESIGPEVVQTLSIRNRGPSAVDGSLVTVNFPRLFQSSKPESYLLYLLIVELVGGSGSCHAIVNPLNIQAANESSAEKENQEQRRRRRDTDNKLLSCRTTSCQQFKCNLGQLALGDKVDIKLTFRLWENTLLEELETPVAVDLITEATVKVPAKVTQPNKENDETTVITTAKPASTEQQKKKTPWWVIFLSVLGGVLLLGAVAAILYKIGFFKRKRIKDITGPTDATELTTK